VRWRLFYLACSELFAFNGGQEWGVGHYVFVKPADASSTINKGQAAATTAN
jgi:cyclopropane-fatty-acyl-phospholipid synthase